MTKEKVVTFEVSDIEKVNVWLDDDWKVIEMRNYRIYPGIGRDAEMVFFRLEKDFN